MKLLTLQGQTPRSESSTQREAATPRPRLPRDATVTFNNDPPELYIHMSITKIEHIHALMESLNTYASQLEYARRRDDDR